MSPHQCCLEHICRYTSGTGVPTNLRRIHVHFSDLLIKNQTVLFSNAMAIKQVIHITLLYLLSHIFIGVVSERCIKGGSGESIYGWKLQGHIYKTMKANFGYECLLICRQDNRCQSFNWVISVNMCEFSDRTKEARSEDFVPDPDRYYYRRDMNRGKMSLVAFYWGYGRYLGYGTYLIRTF